MIYKEEKKDLFKVSSKYFLVHCISADFALGAGIAATFSPFGLAVRALIILPVAAPNFGM